MILKRMKRRHSRQDVVDFCKKVRKMRPDAAFGADIIAGFPTEDEDFGLWHPFVNEVVTKRVI